MSTISRRADPFQALLDLQRALTSGASRSRGAAGAAERTAGRAFPNVNVFRRGEDFVALAELPGIDKGSLDIQVLGNRVRVAGARSIDPADGRSVHRRERAGGQFDRTFDLPVEIDAEGVTAELRDGILAIHLPRAASDKPRTVPIG